MRRNPLRSGAAALVAILAVAGCSPESSEPARSEKTREVEALAGDFLEYYGEVLELARRYSAQPDSFRIALDALPGSHVTEEQWADWTAPYRSDPEKLADRLEEMIAELSGRK